MILVFHVVVTDYGGHGCLLCVVGPAGADPPRKDTPTYLLARATVRHRTRRFAFCEARVEQEDGQVVAEARALIAYVKA